MSGFKIHSVFQDNVAVAAGGFPCRDVSTAGNGAALARGTRSGWGSSMAAAVEALRPGSW